MSEEVYAPHAVTVGVLLIVTAALLWMRQQKKTPLLDKQVFRQFKLIRKTTISPNTAVYRFELPAGRGLDLPIGQHVSVRAVIDGKEVVRSYTPTSLSSDLGYFELLIKSYPTGQLSKWFGELTLGAMVEVRGPKGNFLYQPNMCSSIGMIAGGTGITPMLQIIRAVLGNESDNTRLSLIFANVNEPDILLRDQLDALTTRHKNFSVFYVLNNPPAGWKGGCGFVTQEMIKEHLPAPSSDSKLLLCGPPPMIKVMQQYAEDLGFDKTRAISKVEDQVFKF